MEMLELDPGELTEHQRENLLLWGVVPRPVAMVSTVSPWGAVNLAPFSYFTAVGYTPMSLLFCAGRKRDMSEKDSCRNARPRAEGGTGEFTVNVLIEDHAPAATAAAKPLPYGESEYTWAGLRPLPGIAVGTPRIDGSPIAFECRTTEVVPVGQFFIVVGEVVHLSVNEELLDRSDWRIDLDGLNPVGRMGAADYVRTFSRFTVGRQPGDAHTWEATSADWLQPVAQAGRQD
jgi:flavin reductase (DIM6/NTAB) family NADH-FMN oxidoreductase RutF